MTHASITRCCISILSVWIIIVSGCGEISDEEASDLGESSQASTVLTNGTPLTNGLNLPNGTPLTNGTTLSGALNLNNGNQSSIGMTLPLGEITPSGSLKAWLDSSPAPNKKVLQYLIECALTNGTSISLIYPTGTTTTYTGRVGFGPGLKNGPMTVTEQEKVSACLLARINQLGYSLNINLVGPSSSFGPGWNTRSSADASGYPYDEAAFAGNLFVNPPKTFVCGAGAFSFNAATFCTSRACSASCTVNPDNYTGSCGIVKFEADCHTQCSQTPSRGFVDPYFHACQDDNNNRQWDHVLTSYIMRYSFGQPCHGAWECISQSCTNGTCG
jgi:hypothetical protein